MLNIHYPSVYSHFDDEMIKIGIESWHYGLQDLDAKLVFHVALKFITMNEKGYPPNLATIRKECLKAMQPSQIIPSEVAFEMAKKTVIKYGRYNKEKGLESIANPSVKRALLGVGWDRIANASDDEIGYVKNDFVKLYSEVDLENKEQYLVPKGTLAKLQSVAEQKKLEQLNEMPKM